MCSKTIVQALQFTSPPPGQKTLAGFLQGGVPRDSRPFRGAAQAPDAGGADRGSEAGGASAGQPTALCEGLDSGSGQGPGGGEDAGGAARAASAYFAVATAPGGRARLPGAYGEARTGAYGEAGGVAGPLGAQSSGSGGHAEASVNAGGSSGLAPNTVEEPGEGSGSQALMPSLRDWAVPSGAPDDAGGPGRAAVQEGFSLAPSGDAGDAGEGGWPAEYFPAEAEAGWADIGGAEDEEEEDTDAGAAGLAAPGDPGGPTLAPRMAASFDRVGGEQEDEACGNAAAHAAGRAGSPGDARGPAGGALRDRGALARWQCLVCTFAGNRAEVLRCALCDTLKGSRAWQPPRAPQALPEALPGSLAATLGLLSRSSALAPGSGDAPRCGGAAAEGPAGFYGPGAGASDALASDASAGSAPAAEEAEGAELPLGSAAGAAQAHGGLAKGTDAAAGSQAVEPDWEPVDGAAGGGWRCRRCSEVLGCGIGSDEGSDLEAGSAGAQARGAHDDWHFALEVQRRESGAGHEPGPRGLGPGASGAGERFGGGAGRGVEAGGRGAGGRKRKAGANANPVRDRSRLSRGTMDAFLRRANAKGG